MLNEILKTLMSGQGVKFASESIIEELYYGRIAPYERKIQHSPKQFETVEKMDNIEDYFKEKMAADDYERLNLLKKLYIETSEDEEIEVFTHGFTIGVLIMLEVFGHKDKVINK